MLGLGATQQRSHLFVTCNSVQRHEAASQEGVKNFHLWFQAFSIKCVHHGNDVKVTGEDDFLSFNNTI